MVDLTPYRLPALLAVLLHFGVFGLLVQGGPSYKVTASPTIKAIEARLVSVKELSNTRATANLASQPTSTLKPKPKPKPKPKLKPKPKPKPERMVKAPSIDSPKPSIIGAVDAERSDQQKAAEDALMASMSAEVKTEKATEQDIRVSGYAAMISQQMRQRWQLPPSARRDMVCLLKIRLSPSGRVVAVTLASSSGSYAFDQSSLLAVKKAGDFRFIKDLPAALFEQHFREFIFRFSAEDLRL